MPPLHYNLCISLSQTQKVKVVKTDVVGVSGKAHCFDWKLGSKRAGETHVACQPSPEFCNSDRDYCYRSNKEEAWVLLNILHCLEMTTTSSSQLRCFNCLLGFPCTLGKAICSNSLLPHFPFCWDEQTRCAKLSGIHMQTKVWNC